jgi:MFS family permease
MPDRYKWVALSNVTLGVLLATLDASIVLIAMPDIFRGIGLSPLRPGNSFYLLWMILGYLVVTSVLVVGLGRLGDLFGRVKMYTLGFAIYTVASLLLTIDWMHGRAGADWLIGFRLVQGVGAAFLIANSAAILTDAASTTSSGSAASSSGCCWVVCSRRSTGGSSSSFRCRSGSSGRSGRIASCARSACTSLRRSTGWGTRPSRSGSS